MNGAHDLGGAHGFGPVSRTEPGTPFEQAWEGRVFALLVIATGQGLTTASENRHAVERMGNVAYLTTTYYEHWLSAAETVLVDNGVIRPDELEHRRQEARTGRLIVPRSGIDPHDPLTAQMSEGIRGEATARRGGPRGRFRVGDRVWTRNQHPAGHTRLPRYARGKEAVVHAAHGSWIFPDAEAAGRGDVAKPVYTVRFAAQELWGEDADSGTFVYLDVWEPYLRASRDASNSDDGESDGR